MNLIGLISLSCQCEQDSSQNFTHTISGIADCVFFFPVTYVEQVLKKLKEVNYGSLATVVGRYYAMDRDKRWERIKIAYEALVQGIGETTTTDKVIEVYKKMYLI